MFITLHNLSVTYSTAPVLIIDNVVLSEHSILFSLFFKTEMVRMGIQGIA